MLSNNRIKGLWTIFAGGNDKVTHGTNIPFKF